MLTPIAAALASGGGTISSTDADAIVASLSTLKATVDAEGGGKASYSDCSAHGASCPSAAKASRTMPENSQATKTLTYASPCP
jgi:hypothetical protein